MDYKYKKAFLRMDPVFIKYLLVGGLNTSLAYCIFAFFVFLGINYAVATLLAGVASIFIGFNLHKAFVFKVQHGNFARFIVLFMVIYLLNVSMQTVLLGVGMNKYFAGFIATFLCAFISFVLLKLLVFVRPD